MSRREHMNLLMKEIGPAMGVAGVFEIEEGCAWEVVIEEGFVLALDYSEPDDRLTVTGDIIALGPAPPADLLMLMLQYNAASTETGGVRLALDADARALQIYDMPTADLTVDGLKIVLLGLADKIVAWRNALGQRQRQQTQGAATAAPAELENLIKV